MRDYAKRIIERRSEIDIFKVIGFTLKPIIWFNETMPTWFVVLFWYVIWFWFLADIFIRVLFYLFVFAILVASVILNFNV